MTPGSVKTPASVLSEVDTIQTSGIRKKTAIRIRTAYSATRLVIRPGLRPVRVRASMRSAVLAMPRTACANSDRLGAEDTEVHHADDQHCGGYQQCHRRRHTKLVGTREAGVVDVEHDRGRLVRRRATAGH